MKSKKLIIAAAVLVLMTILTVAHAQQPWQPKKEIRDKLIQPTDILYRQFGYSDDTLVLYNIWANQAACKNFEIRVLKLEEQIAELQKELAGLLKRLGEFNTKTEESTILPTGAEPEDAAAGGTDPAAAEPVESVETVETVETPEK